MFAIHGVHWSGIFLDAYTYSTNYLLFTLTTITVSIISVWIYEKPQIYKLIHSVTMFAIHGVHWSGIFLDAYTYSTNYLLFTLTIITVSIISVWIYEKPQIYKLISNKSKHSNTISPVQSGNVLPDGGSECEHEDLIQKRPEEIAKINVNVKIGNLGPKNDNDQHHYSNHDYLH